MRIGTIETIKMNAATGKYLYIIDTMNEIQDSQVADAIGNHEFYLVHIHTIEGCKTFITQLDINIDDKHANDCCIIINRPDMLVSTKSMENDGVPMPREPYDPDTCEPVKVEPGKSEDDYVWVRQYDWPLYKDLIRTIMSMTRLNIVILRGVPRMLVPGSIKERYSRIAKSEWFKEAYENRPVGQIMEIEETCND